MPIRNKYSYRFFVVSVWLLNFVSCFGQANNSVLNVDEFEKQLANSPTSQLIDVRTPEEYNAGHIKGAINFDFTDTSFNRKFASLDKKKPVFVYCLTGNRSGPAIGRMNEAGFKDVYELDGGLMKWAAASKPIEKIDQGNSPGPKPGLKITEDEFWAKIKGSPVVLVEFGAPWCGPCK